VVEAFIVAVKLLASLIGSTTVGVTVAVVVRVS
jgi:hypothetical protein